MQAPTLRTGRMFHVPFVGRVFLVVVCIHGAALLCLVTMAILAVERRTDTEERYGERVYASVVEAILGVSFVFFAWSAILYENVFELMAFIVAALLLTARVLYEYIVWTPDSAASSLFGVNGLEIIEIVQVSLTVAFVFMYLVLGYMVFQSFGWHVYKNIGADASLVKCYTRYQQFLSLLKLDLMFGILLTFTGLMGRAWNTEWGFALTCISLIVTFGWVLLGWKSSKLEWEWGIRAVLLFALFEPAYLCYKIVGIKENLTGERGPSPVKAEEALPRFDMSFDYVVVLVIIGLLVRLGVVVMLFLVKRNFGGGLKQRLNRAPSDVSIGSTPLFN